MIGDRLSHPYIGRMTLSVAARRIAYRAAHRVLRLYWLLARPRLTGVKAVLVDGGEVLLVRHTYGSRLWDLPGGGVRRGEPPITAIRREITEELGVELADPEPIGVLRLVRYHRAESVHLFRARVSHPPLTLALAELERADWFPRDRLPAGRERLVDEILAHV